MSKHFSHKELACPMTGVVKLQPGFIDLLEELREAYGKPMTVTSGCRSDEYNADLAKRGYAASPNSLHLMYNIKYGTNTCAVDIARPPGPDFHRLLELALPRGWTAGIAKSFIHLDQRAAFTELPAIIYTY